MKSAQHTSPDLHSYRLLHVKELNMLHFIYLIVILGLHDSQQTLALMVHPYAAAASASAVVGVSNGVIRGSGCVPLPSAWPLWLPEGLSSGGKEEVQWAGTHVCTGQKPNKRGESGFQFSQKREEHTRTSPTNLSPCIWA